MHKSCITSKVKSTTQNSNYSRLIPTQNRVQSFKKIITNKGRLIYKCWRSINKVECRLPISYMVAKVFLSLFSLSIFCKLQVIKTIKKYDYTFIYKVSATKGLLGKVMFPQRIELSSKGEKSVVLYYFLESPQFARRTISCLSN